VPNWPNRLANPSTPRTTEMQLGRSRIDIGFIKEEHEKDEPNGKYLSSWGKIYH
jgi:hypothetical protein